MKKSELSRPRQRLVELMQDLHFGRICDLVIRHGEPVFDPAPRTEEQVRFGGANGPRRERRLQDFVLKADVVALFQEIDRLQNGRILKLEVKYGLPLGMTVARDAA